MHLVTLNMGGRLSPGLFVGDAVLDIPTSAPVLPEARSFAPSLRGILEAGDAGLEALARLRDRAERAQAALIECGALVPRTHARLAAPVPDTAMVLSAGMNYHEHLKEMKTPAPATPAAFVKSNAAIVGPGEPIVLPASHPDMVDWEGEFSAVFHKPCHRVRAAEALDYIAGYTLVNDVSARDWVAPVFKAQGVMGPIAAWEHNLLGKQFPSFCPFGPTIATKDEIGDPNNVQLTTTLNGRVMQSANTDDLVFPLARLIEYYSQFYRFRPGDVITTGSPSGVGYGRDPKLFMRAGDTVCVTVEAIGALANPVVAATSSS